MATGVLQEAEVGRGEAEVSAATAKLSARDAAAGVEACGTDDVEHTLLLILPPSGLEHWAVPSTTSRPDTPRASETNSILLKTAVLQGNIFQIMSNVEKVNLAI